MPHTVWVGSRAKQWVGAGTLALRPLVEVSLVLKWLVYTPSILYNLCRPGSRYQSGQADSAKLGCFLTQTTRRLSAHVAEKVLVVTFPLQC